MLQVAEVMQDFVKPHGDRRQEIVFIGQNLNKSAITRALDDCLCLEKDLREVGDAVFNYDINECILVIHSTHCVNALRCKMLLAARRAALPI